MRWGFPWTADDPSEQAIPADTAADRIDAAFRQTRSNRIHLCPLDLADAIPTRHFGPIVVRTFKTGELNSFVDPHGVMRKSPGRCFDSQQFSQFSWLVVKESVELPGEPGERTFPNVFIDLDSDSGHIEPHRPRFPPAVEAALFALLTAPWEDITGYNNYDWRPFHTPWVYTLDDDLFARIPVPPDADSLTWEPDFCQDRDGEMIEFERSSHLPLNEDADEKTNYLNDEFWHRLAQARMSPLFAGPVPHFLVRAFVTDGITEFLAHIMVIEAALGAHADYLSRPKSKSSDNRKATDRVAARLSTLLDDPGAGARYSELFNERSRFVHGRTMSDITSKSRLEARRLARRCACALISAATSEEPPENRDAFLENLLQRNWSLT